VKSEPNQARYHAELGRSWNALGYLYDEKRENNRAIPEFLKAIKEQKIAIARSPDDNDYKGYLCIHLENLGEQYADLNEVADAYPYCLQAMEFRRQLHASHPENRVYTLQLADALSRLGILQRHAGDSVAAHSSFAEASDVVEKLAAASPGTPDIVIQRGAALTREAWAEADLNQPQKALQLLHQAIDLLEPLSKSRSQAAPRRAWLTEAFQTRTHIFRTLNQAADADKSDADRVALWKGQPAGELAALALTQAGRTALIGYGKNPVSGPKKSIRDLDLEQAASNLRLAIANGFTDLRMLESNPDSALLLSRDDLKSLIKALAAPVPAAQAGPKK
jgi:tetratricopeptide (TPR) repeat protein